LHDCPARRFHAAGRCLESFLTAMPRHAPGGCRNAGRTWPDRGGGDVPGGSTHDDR